MLTALKVDLFFFLRDYYSVTIDILRLHYIYPFQNIKCTQCLHKGNLPHTVRLTKKKPDQEAKMENRIH
jgi:hypothetical protein